MISTPHRRPGLRLVVAGALGGLALAGAAGVASAASSDPQDPETGYAVVVDEGGSPVDLPTATTADCPDGGDL